MFLRNQDKQQDPEYAARKEYSCPTCKQKYITSQGLNIHRRKKIHAKLTGAKHNWPCSNARKLFGENAQADYNYKNTNDRVNIQYTSLQNLEKGGEIDRRKMIYRGAQQKKPCKVYLYCIGGINAWHVTIATKQKQYTTSRICYNV